MTGSTYDGRGATRRFGFAATLATLCTLATSCTFTPTEVIVGFHSDAPENRVLNIVATVRTGIATTGPGEERRWTRGTGEGGIALPATFAIVPGQGPRDGVVTLVLEAELLGNAAGEPTVNFRRIARFSFAPRVRGSLPIFLAASCGSRSTDCTSGIANCTVSARCEELGQTCGDDGACVAVQVTPTPAPEDAGVPFADIPPRDIVDVAAAIDVRADVPMDAAADVPPADVPVVDVPPVDQGSPVDADTDAGAALTPPTQLSPLSTSLITSRRLAFTWSLPAGVDGARLEVCRDRACTMLIDSMDVTGTRATIARDLTDRVVYWRLFPRAGTRVGTRASPVWQFVPGRASRTSSRTWGSILDLNGDGYGDIAVGAPYAGTGRVVVYYGSATGITMTGMVTLSGVDAGSEFGTSVASAGDVNGDGFGDLVVGARGAMTDRGSMFVYLGSATGVQVMPAARIDGPDGAPGTFGYRVATAGDVNHDGRADVIVSAPGVLRAGSPYAGKVYVFLGTATGIAAAASWSYLGLDDGGFLGDSIAAIGDIDNDDYGDLMFSAANAIGYNGRVFVAHGAPLGVLTRMSVIESPMMAGEHFGDSLACIGDVSGDGIPDVFIGASQEGVAGAPGRGYIYNGTATGISSTITTVLVGPDSGGSFAHAAAGAGDVNGDGFDDVIIGAYQPMGTGRAHVFHGGTMGLPSTPSTTITGVANAEFGQSVSGAGDTNLDGFMDVIVGAPATSGGSGQAMVYRSAGAAGINSTPAPSLTIAIGGTFGFSVALATPEWRIGARRGAQRLPLLRSL